MNKLNFIIIILIIALLSSCENNPQGPENPTGENREELIVNESYPTKFTAQGKVIKIDNNGLHVQDEDKVDVYNVDPERTRNIYIGEYVGINKLDGNKFDVVADEYHDYNTRITTEGKAITRVTGTVSQSSKDNIIVATENGELKLSRARDFDLVNGDQLMVDYVELTGSNQMLAFYDEASKLTVTAKEISRDNNGMMRIYALSDSNVEYDIMVGADTITNFMHSSLEPEDQLMVYPNDISGDVPALVDAKLILLSRENED